MTLANLLNPLRNAFAAFEVIYEALPISVRGFILVVCVLFFFSAIFSIFRG